MGEESSKLPLTKKNRQERLTFVLNILLIHEIFGKLFSGLTRQMCNLFKGVHPAAHFISEKKHHDTVVQCDGLGTRHIRNWNVFLSGNSGIN